MGFLTDSYMTVKGLAERVREAERHDDHLIHIYGLEVGKKYRIVGRDLDGDYTIEAVDHLRFRTSADCFDRKFGANRTTQFRVKGIDEWFEFERYFFCYLDDELAEAGREGTE